ncbi:MAG: DNA polymerase III subunit beta [Candidatus Omnitrophota bacterium]
MKVFFSKNELLKGVQIAQDVVNSKATLPILSNFLLETQDGGVKITATDLDLGVLIHIPAKIEREGSITIPAKKFADIIKELPEGDFLLEIQKNNQVVIDAKPCFFKLLGLPKDEFPIPPKPSKNEKLVIEQAVFKQMLKLTSFAVSRDETRYVLNGIFFKAVGEFLELAATDGRRLAVVKEKVSIPKGMIKEIIVPLKTINELNRVLQDNGNVEILFSENQVCFDLENIRIISRVIEGEFPNYTNVIPKESKEKIILDKGRFFEALRRINLLTSPDSPSVKIDVFKNKIIISKSTPEFGNGQDVVDLAEEYTGKELSVGFNPIYLMDVFKNTTESSISLELSAGDKPGVIRFGTQYTYVVLPMQTV